jgi:hypothetical protein
MSLPVAHDIAETLQMKLEELQEIERGKIMFGGFGNIPL